MVIARSELEPAEIPLLAGLDTATADRVLAGASVSRAAVGRTLFVAGEAAEHLHVLLEGTVELYADCAGQECDLFLLMPGAAFMIEAALFGEPYLNSARAVRPAKVVKIPAALARAVFADSEAFRNNVTRALGGQFRDALQHIVDLRTRSAPQRLGAFLLRLVSGGRLAEARVPWPKRTLAARLGMSPETLSRSIQSVARNGLVLRGRRIIVRDRTRIERFCDLKPGREGSHRGPRSPVL